MAEQTSLRKLLVLHGPAFEAQGILAFLREHFQVQIAEELDGALDAMRHERFDGILAETADFLPLERGIVTQQASVILDTIGDGICIVGPRGELVWANRRLRDYPQSLLESIQKVCATAMEQFSALESKPFDRGRRFSIMPEGGFYYEVICSPVRDRQNVVRQVAAVVVDATAQRRQQLKINAIDRAGRELVRLDYESLSRLDAQQRLRLLEDRIIRYSNDVLNYQHFAILLLDERTNRLETVMSAGLKIDHKSDLFASSEGNGICGYVAATGRSYICHDVMKDPRYLAGLDGAQSSLTVPLRLHDKVIGVLNAESARLNAFNEEDRQFAEIFANYIALALHILNLLVFERHSTHTQVSGSICAELAGPLNDVIAEANELLEDYIGMDDLRKRLNSIIDRATFARQTMHHMASGAQTGVVASAGKPSGPDAVLGGKRVLVADDEELIRNTIRDVLLPLGCMVDICADGAQARECIACKQYDLVISDIKMPNASGYEVFSAAIQAHPQTRVILITGFGYDPGHTIVRANNEGLSAVLMKPFKVKELLDKCRSALASAPK